MRTKAEVVSYAVLALACIVVALLVHSVFSPVELTESANGGTQQLLVGEKLTLRLKGYGPMGGWQIQRCDRGVLEVISGPDVGTETESFTFEAQAPGRCLLALTYRGVARGGQPQPFSLTVSVE